MRAAVAILALCACGPTPQLLKHCPMTPVGGLVDTTGAQLQLGGDILTISPIATGCDETVCYWGFVETSPVQADLEIRGTIGCAPKPGALSLDLSATKASWRDGYRRQTGSIIFNLGNSSATYSF